MKKGDTMFTILDSSIHEVVVIGCSYSDAFVGIKSTKSDELCEVHIDDLFYSLDHLLADLVDNYCFYYGKKNSKKS